MDYKDVPGVPKIIDVTVGGVVYPVKRFGIGKLKTAAAHLSYVAFLMDRMKPQVDAAGSPLLDASGDPIKQYTPIDVLLEGGDSALALLRLATGMSDADVDDCDPLEAANLLMAIAEVNVDFFVNALMPNVEGLKARAMALAEKVGSLKAASNS